MISNAISNAVRFLSADAVQKAKSGHPGAPMGMADIANVLWRKYLNHNPLNPSWINRDRFIKRSWLYAPIFIIAFNWL